MDHQFKRLLNLVRRTGDRLVVTDPNGEDTYVLMGLEAYEKLADHLPSVEPEPWDKPRHFDDYYLDDYYDEDYDDDYDDEDEKIDFEPKWEVPDELSPDLVTDKTDKKIWDVMSPAGDKSETWNPEKFGEEEKKVVAEKFPSQAPIAPIAPVAPATPDEPGEEQFYLEPIE